MQASEFCEVHSSLTLLPITATLQNASLFRFRLHPNAQNGLLKESDVEIDKVQTVKREKIGYILGELDVWTMRRVDDALRRWLKL